MRGGQHGGHRAARGQAGDVHPAGIDRVGAPGFEADDVIGTLATRARGPVDIVTGDRDLFQLVDDERGVRVLYTNRGIADIETVDGVHPVFYGMADAKIGVARLEHTG